MRFWPPSKEGTKCWILSTSFFDARDNKAVPPLGTLDRTRIKAWLDQMDQRFAGIASWIP